jgi:hypothetical protein
MRVFYKYNGFGTVARMATTSGWPTKQPNNRGG